MTLTRGAMIALLWLAVHTLVAADSAALVAQLAAAHSKATTIEGRFTQRTSRSDDAGAEPRVLKAVFAVQFPDCYDLVFTRPDDEEWRQRLCSDGERRWVLEQSFANTPPDVTITRVGDNDAELKRLFACLRMDVSTLERDFSLEAVAQEGIQVTLTPKAAAGDRAASPERIVAAFDAAHHLKKLMITDGNGNRHDLTVDRAEYGAVLSPARFRGSDDR